MFASKIWLFLVTIAAAIAVTIALALPHSANQTRIEVEHTRLAVACGVVDILLAKDARNRVDLAGQFARKDEVVTALEQASGTDKLDDAKMKSYRETGENVVKNIQGARKPDFAMMVDKRGRVAARIKLDDTDYGDVVAGRPLVDDALAGYLRDDLWVQGSTLFLVSAAPVIKKDGGDYVGAVVLGHRLTQDLAQKLVGDLDVDISFFVGQSDAGGSKTVSFDKTSLSDNVKKLTAPDVSSDCRANQPFDLKAGGENYSAIVARLPGEAGEKQAFFSVFVKKPEPKGTLAYFSEAREGGGLGFASFPWLVVGGGFLVALVVGVGLMIFESDRPLRRLAADAVKLAKGETERMSEDSHPGKFGTVARSVNIHIDKLGREAKSAKKDLDQLLGPAPDGSLGTIDLLATALPASRPGGAGPLLPPPPSEFRFSDASSSGSMSSAPPVPARVTPPPMPAMSAPPMSVAPPTLRTTPSPVRGQPSPPALDDDILARQTLPPPMGQPMQQVSDSGPTMIAGASQPQIDPYFKQVFDQFVAVKKSCNEPVSGLTYAKFADKLVKNRDDLMSKTGCREVRFTVYVKDGKAALKATPVKDE